MTIPNVDLRYQLTIQRPDGTVRTVQEGQSESFVVQFIQHLRSAFRDVGEFPVTDVSGTDIQISEPIDSNDKFMDVNARTGIKGFGPAIGSGNTPVSITDFSLDSKLTTNVDYSDTDIQRVSTSDPDAEFAIQRDFTNNTGSTVTAEESGVICRSENRLNNTRDFLLIRDTIDPTDIQNNETASLEYVVTVTA